MHIYVSNSEQCGVSALSQDEQGVHPAGFQSTRFRSSHQESKKFMISVWVPPTSGLLRITDEFCLINACSADAPAV